jgi:ribosomal protein S18 acetylase RimI-like enzyme
MSDILIVRLKPEKWQLYKQLRLESLLNDPQAFGPTYASTLQNPDSFWQGRLQDAQVGERSWLLFAREGDRLVGMIGAFREAGGEAGGETAHIVSVYVSPDRRGQGIGRALMEAILAEVSQQAGIRKAVLGVTQTQAAAVALYKRFGFQVVGEKSGVMSDGLTHAGYMMEKPLRPE